MALEDGNADAADVDNGLRHSEAERRTRGSTDWAGGRVCLISPRGTVRHSEREGLVERRRDRATDDVGSLGLDDLVLLQQAHPHVHVCVECASVTSIDIEQINI